MSDTELDPSGTSDGPKSDEGIKQKQVLIELNRESGPVNVIQQKQDIILKN